MGDERLEKMKADTLAIAGVSASAAPTLGAMFADELHDDLVDQFMRFLGYGATEWDSGWEKYLAAYITTAGRRGMAQRIANRLNPK